MNLSNITHGTQQKPPRIVILGAEKVGKTTFAAGAPSPIFLPIGMEQGVDYVEAAKFPQLKTHKEVLEALDALEREEHNFLTVVLDSSSALEPLIIEEVLRMDGKARSINNALGGYGSGQAMCATLFGIIAEKLDRLREKGMTSIIIGHTKIREVKDPTGENYTKFSWSIDERAEAKLLKWCDVCLYAATKVVVNDEGKAKSGRSGERFLFTATNPATPAGGRGPFGNLPDIIPLNWNAFIEAAYPPTNSRHTAG